MELVSSYLMKESVGSFFLLLLKTPNFMFKRFVKLTNQLIFTGSYKSNSIMPFQLVDVYRLLEDQIDVPSVALQVAQGKASLCMEVQEFRNLTFAYIF